jgi:hypothetical protein
MIRRTIHRVRQRSRDERVAFAAMVAITVTGVLFLAWAVYLFISFRNTLHSTNITTATSTVDSAPLQFNNDSAVPDQSDFQSQ